MLLAIAVVPNVAQASSACDDLLEKLPPRGPDRLAAGKPCIDELLSLPRADQTRIVRHYARNLPDYIAPAEIDSVVDGLPEDIALPLAAYAARYSAIGPGDELTQKVDGLVASADQQGDDLAMAHLQFLMAARVFRNGGDHAVMERHLQQGLSLAKKTKAIGLIPYITNSLAVRAKVDGEYDVAIIRYREALEQFEATGDLGSIGIAYGNIGNIFSDLGDNEQAIEMYRRSVEIYLEHSPEQEQRLATAYTNLGTAHSIEGNYDQSNEAFELAREYSDRLPTRRLDGLINYQNAVALFEAGNRAEAIPMAQRSIDQILEHRDPSEAATALNWLAARHLEDRNLAAARISLEQARAIMEPEGTGAEGLLDNPGNTFWAQEYAQSMGSLLMALGRREEAASYFDVALQLSSERFEREKMSAVVNSELLFEVRDRDLLLERMENEATISELKLEQSRLQLIAAIAAAIAIALLGVAGYRAYIAQKREARVKDVFLTEIHHRTKNNLQLLTSILNLDARREKGAKQPVEQQVDASNRARTMALVHDHIYAQETPTSTMVDANAFVDDLLVLLEQSLGRDDVELTWHTDSETIDVSELTSLGLLISELVTNAYKHAFKDKGGVIDVRLESCTSGFQLTVMDDGSGFDHQPGTRRIDGLGLSLIDDLVNQLGGKSEVTSDESGTVWKVSVDPAA
ncbi:tetratricopeptide repeat protein [Qipengyuania sp. DGS5-3]|uniref:tetratricopeptide repeat protein n=1 Tax=Qipengyuania sp. DGS5-3 TaxID=3349632 RepID=UPI0036D23419